MIVFTHIYDSAAMPILAIRLIGRCRCRYSVGCNSDILVFIKNELQCNVLD